MGIIDPIPVLLQRLLDSPERFFAERFVINVRINMPGNDSIK
jgi:hypothetical protein